MLRINSVRGVLLGSDHLREGCPSFCRVLGRPYSRGGAFLPALVSGVLQAHSVLAVAFIDRVLATRLLNTPAVDTAVHISRSFDVGAKGMALYGQGVRAAADCE